MPVRRHRTVRCRAAATRPMRVDASVAQPPPGRTRPCPQAPRRPPRPPWACTPPSPSGRQPTPAQAQNAGGSGAARRRAGCRREAAAHGGRASAQGSRTYEPCQAASRTYEKSHPTERLISRRAATLVSSLASASGAPLQASENCAEKTCARPGRGGEAHCGVEKRRARGLSGWVCWERDGLGRGRGRAGKEFAEGRVQEAPIFPLFIASL